MYRWFFDSKSAIAAFVVSGLTAQSALAAGPAPGSYQRQGGALAPFVASSMFLLTDGTVMVQVARTTAWRRLCPDIHGSYVHGTWGPSASCPAIASIPASFNYAPFFYASAVLPDGRLIIMGGEYNTATGVGNANQGAIYNPKTNQWLPVRPPTGWTGIGDAQSVVLPNGQWMIADCCNEPKNQALFNPNNLTWTPTGANFQSGNDEAGWTLLPDGSVLTVDINNGFATSSTSERWVKGTWNPAQFPQASTNNELSDCTYEVVANTAPYIVCPSTHQFGNNEMGPQLLLPNQTVFAIGATGKVSIYTPSTNKWVASKALPSTGCGPDSQGLTQCEAADAPAVLLPNGNVLLFAGPTYANAGCQTFEWDGANWNPVVTDVPNAATDPSWEGQMLLLPTGDVLFTDESSDVQIYTGTGSPNPAWAPTITSFPTTITRGLTYNIYGTLFNGMSQANAYGDDHQNSTNYPLVRVTNISSGHIFYGRTHDHSAMGVAMTTAPCLNQIRASAGTETGLSELEVVANGIPSPKVLVTVN